MLVASIVVVMDSVFLLHGSVMGSQTVSMDRMKMLTCVVSSC